ncbi:rap guanine nucleotide exchange factor 6 [Eurytemora carolleeae]|uniref:rap guanine nucleotide exchange factor 6 n=1 Tax=Eurytemora carolleeae TaxID=1294199 RepID=UPI000C78D7DC|nr:rap guanine nucleotide exchange factor 6 [Eurytemora carolleeae]|eukprot:XP_023330788.1 rap guanine nucleotide exchange factor 6-like [Eurytemora affinis]
MREVVLKGGAPWGFRMTGGADQHHTLKISRVNPGSKAAEKLVREGDLIYRINGYDTANLSNQEAHILLRSCKDNLYLILNQKGKERRKETEIDLLQGWEHLDNIKNNTENPETEIKKDPELSEEEETAKQNYREDTKKENTQNEENKMENDLKNIGKEEKVKKYLEKSKLISFKSLHNIHLAFLHEHEDKIKSPLPLPATPESIFLKLFRERKLSNHSEDGDTSTLRSIHGNSLFSYF